MAVPPTDGDSTVHGAQELIVAALIRLAPEHWQITPVPGMVIATRRWSDGSQDTVIVLSPATAYARRENDTGLLVWHTRGTAEAVVAAAQDLAPPRSPGAPDEPVPGPTDWSV